MPRFDRRERRQQCRGRGEQRDGLRVAPARLRRVDDRVDQQREGAGDRQRARRVVAAPLARRPALAQEHGRERQRERSHRDVDEEDPLPAQAVDDGPTDQPCGRAAEPAEGAPDPERLVALRALVEDRRDDREGGRRHDGRADSLQRTGRDQGLVRPGQAAQQRRDREEDEPDHEHAAAPEQVRCTATQQEEAGEGEGVGAHDPLEPLRREAEVRLDRRERDVHDRRVEDDHEERAAEEGERPPPPGIGSRLHHRRLPLSKKSMVVIYN